MGKQRIREKIGGDRASVRQTHAESRGRTCRNGSDTWASACGGKKGQDPREALGVGKKNATKGVNEALRIKAKLASAKMKARWAKR